MKEAGAGDACSTDSKPMLCLASHRMRRLCRLEKFSISASRHVVGSDLPLFMFEQQQEGGPLTITLINQAISFFDKSHSMFMGKFTCW